MPNSRIKRKCQNLRGVLSFVQSADSVSLSLDLTVCPMMRLSFDSLRRCSLLYKLLILERERERGLRLKMFVFLT